MRTNYTEVELDALRELANIGSGTASTALSSMLGRSVDISVPNASVLPIEWHGCKVNILDLPGYPDFIGDLHAAARVVESMIIVTEANARENRDVHKLITHEIQPFAQTRLFIENAREIAINAIDNGGEL